MPSIFKRKREQAKNAKMETFSLMANAPEHLRPLLKLISDDLWAKDYKMATARCERRADELDNAPQIRERLCALLPDYAQFVAIREKAKAGQPTDQP